MIKNEQYKRAYNFGQKVVILDTEQVGPIVGVQESRYQTVFEIEVACGVTVRKTKKEIADFGLWSEGKE